MNTKKTKMCNRIAKWQRRGVQTDREQLEVSEYKCPGRLTTSENEMSRQTDQDEDGLGSCHFFKDSKIPKEKDHRYSHFVSCDVWLRDMDIKKGS